MDMKQIAKEAIEEAEKETREKQKQLVKDIVLKTLEKLNHVRKELKEKQEEERILKMDLDDLKEGKIDRIVERQETDPKAKEVSVVVIIKEKEVIHEHHYHDHWYWPYIIQWQVPYTPVYYTPVQPAITIQGNGLIGTVTSNNFCGTSNTISNAVGISNYTISCSAAKDATIGAYNVDGNIIHLR